MKKPVKIESKPSDDGEGTRIEHPLTQPEATKTELLAQAIRMTLVEEGPPPLSETECAKTGLTPPQF